MTRGKKRLTLIDRLTNMKKNHPESDQEGWHYLADALILEYINDPEITKAFDSVPKWYS